MHYLPNSAHVVAEGSETRPTLHIRRSFAAPRALVWRAWSRPESLVAWMGPVDWPAFSAKSDFRVGGTWRVGLRSPETGQELWQGGTYVAIVEPERLVFTFKWEEGHEDGLAVDPLVMVQLTEIDENQTAMDFNHTGLKSESSLTGHRHGWTNSVDRLAAWLAANPD
jgi:uncharacterized protein YndB with AHSA1/START domain